MRAVVIGNGIAGLSAAKAFREANTGAEIVVLSSDPYPTYSACILDRYIAGSIKKEDVFLQENHHNCRAKMEIRLGETVHEIDSNKKEVLLEGGGVIPYDKLIIATGSKPIVPGIIDYPQPGVFVLKTLHDAELIKSFMLISPVKAAGIIGAGPIGIEAGIALKRAGCRVFLIEAQDRVLPTLFNLEIAELVKKQLQSNGIEVYTSKRVKSISAHKKEIRISTHNQEIWCNMLIVATGMIPDTHLAQRAGIAFGPLGGIKVNGLMQTNVEDIYACGDCVEYMDLIKGFNSLALQWHCAKRQGHIAGYNAAGCRKEYPGNFNIIGLDIFGLHAVSMGLTSAKVNAGTKVQRSGKSFFMEITLENNRIMGLQFFGNAINLGEFLNKIYKGDLFTSFTEQIN